VGGELAIICEVSGFQLTASLASSLAWPVIVLGIATFAWLNRSDLTALFYARPKPSGRPLKRLKAGPVEFEWEQLIEATDEQVPTGEVPDPSDGSAVSTELDSIADSVPTAAVLEGFARVEQRLRQITTGLERFRRNPSMGWLARKAFEENLISEETFGAIANLSRLRNEAAHRVGEADITADQAHEYLRLVDRALKAITAP